MATQQKGPNSLLIFGIAALVCIAVLCLYLIPHNDDDGGQVKDKANAAPELKAAIEKYAAAGNWEETEYNTIRQMINNSLTNTAITPAQKKDLDAYATAEYITTLKNAIDRYLLIAGPNSSVQLNNFSQAIARLNNPGQAQILESGIITFRKVVSYNSEARRIMGLEYNGAAIRAISTLKTNTRQALSRPPLSRNVYLGRLQSEYFTEVDQLQPKDELYNTMLSNANQNMSCDIFKSYSFYYRNCQDKILNPQANQPGPNPTTPKTN